MRKAVLALCLSGCAKAQPFAVLEPPDLAIPAEEQDLAARLPDLAAPLPDVAHRDLGVGPPDLSALADLRWSPDLASPPDLDAADLVVPPADLARPSHPRVNEVAPAVAGVELDEYIELIGGEADTPLFGWSLWYQPPGGGFGEQLLSFPLLAVLPARRYLLIAVSGSAYATSADYTYSSPGGGRLGVAGGAVGLFQGLTRIDSVGWGSATGNYVEGAAATAPGGQGCSRLPDGVDTDHNQRDFRVAAPTPRSVNR